MIAEKDIDEIMKRQLIDLEQRPAISKEDEIRKRLEHFCSMPGEYEFKKTSRFSEK